MPATSEKVDEIRLLPLLDRPETQGGYLELEGQSETVGTVSEDAKNTKKQRGTRSSGRGGGAREPGGSGRSSEGKSNRSRRRGQRRGGRRGDPRSDRASRQIEPVDRSAERPAATPARLTGTGTGDGIETGGAPEPRRSPADTPRVDAPIENVDEVSPIATHGPSGPEVDPADRADGTSLPTAERSIADIDVSEPMSPFLHLLLVIGGLAALYAIARWLTTVVSQASH